MDDEEPGDRLDPVPALLRLLTTKVRRAGDPQLADRLAALPIEHPKHCLLEPTVLLELLQRLEGIA